MTSDLEGFSIPDFIHYIYFPILILEKEPVFPFSMFSAKQENYWYHFCKVFGMRWSLTGDWTRDLPQSSQHYTTRLSRRAVLSMIRCRIYRTYFLLRIKDILYWRGIYTIQTCILNIFHDLVLQWTNMLCIWPVHVWVFLS